MCHLRKKEPTLFKLGSTLLQYELTNHSMNEILKLQKEIDRLQDIALKQFEDKRVPNDKNHLRLVKLRKQLERLLKEGK